MWDEDDIAEFEQTTINYQEPEEDPIGVTGFVENLEASIDHEITSGLSISQYIMDAPKREQEALLRERAQWDSSLSQFRTMKMMDSGYMESSWDYEGLTNHFIAKGDESIESYEELNTARKEAVLQSHNNYSDIANRADTMGSIGGFAGAMATQFIEPVNYMVVIPGVGIAATLTTKIAAGSAAGLITELIVQPTIQDWKNENDINYSDTDRYVAYGVSTVFGGAMGFGSHYFSKLLSGLKERRARLKEEANGEAPKDRADESAETSQKNGEDASTKPQNDENDVDVDDVNWTSWEKAKDEAEGGKPKPDEMSPEAKNMMDEDSPRSDEVIVDDIADEAADRAASEQATVNAMLEGNGVTLTDAQIKAAGKYDSRNDDIGDGKVPWTDEPGDKFTPGPTGKTADEIEVIDALEQTVSDVAKEADNIAKSPDGIDTLADGLAKVDAEAKAQQDATPVITPPDAVNVVENIDIEPTVMAEAAEAITRIKELEAEATLEVDIATKQEQIDAINEKLDDIEISDAKEMQLLEKLDDLELEMNMLVSKEKEVEMRQHETEYEIEARRKMEEADADLAKMNETITCMLGGK